MFYINKISLIYILILIIILILIHLYFFKTTETFDDPKNYILDKFELTDILINDYDNYYATFNETDLKVRNSESIKEYKYKIKNSPVTISDEEKKIIINTIYKIKEIFNNYNNIGFNGKKANIMNIYIGIIDGTNYEEGFPHTRSAPNDMQINGILSQNNNFIIIPKYLINKHNLITVLIHEMVHIYQKVYPEDIQFYLDTYNFKKYSYRSVSASISHNETRANPDIDKYVYSNSNNELLYCNYSDNAKSIMDVIYFPINNETNEHPFEMMAYNIELDIKNKYNLFSNIY